MVIYYHHHCTRAEWSTFLGSNVWLKKTLSLNVLKSKTRKSLSVSVLNTKSSGPNYSFFSLSVNLYLHCYKLNELFLSNPWCTQGPAVLPPHLNHFTHLMVILSYFPGLLFSRLLVWLFVLFNRNIPFSMLVCLECWYCAFCGLTLSCLMSSTWN